MARIIMADDDEIVGEVASEALIASGHAVGLFDNGADALKAMRARQLDLVILDCKMPEMSGLLVLREMRGSVELRDTPVLILTGRRSALDTKIAFDEGAQDYMKKPFDPDELVLRVNALLAQKARRTCPQ
jgi:DNA-binding response OmpR family regulator